MTSSSVIQVTCSLVSPTNEMIREEILKQAAHVSRSVRKLQFDQDGMTLSFEAPADEATDLRSRVEELARSIQRALRRLERRVVYRSQVKKQEHYQSPTPPGVVALGPGQVAVSGLSLELLRYFDRAFSDFSQQWSPEPVVTPTLIPVSALAKCDYFRSFPQYVTFATHLVEDMGCIDSFRARHRDRESLDHSAVLDMARPEACLSPAVCYHLYHMLSGVRLKEVGRAYSVIGKCFRFESTNLSDLRRLWDFTMREVVFVGTRDYVLRRRDEAIAAFGPMLDRWHLTGEIRTASDPFFIAPDSTAKTYFQLSSETKYEISLEVGSEERVAVGSFNYHTDFFGRAFDIKAMDGSPLHSVCVAFGLERWIYSFMAQHGIDPGAWPRDVMKGLDLVRSERSRL